MTIDFLLSSTFSFVLKTQFNLIDKEKSVTDSLEKINGNLREEKSKEAYK